MGQGRTNPFAGTRGDKIAMRLFVKILWPLVAVVIYMPAQQALRCRRWAYVLPTIFFFSFFINCRPSHSTTGARISFSTRIVALIPSMKKIIWLKIVNFGQGTLL